MGCSNVVNVVVFTRARVVAELDVVIQAVIDEVDSICDLDCFWDFTICLQVTSFICIVLEDNVSLGILVISQAHQNDVTLVDPDLLHNKNVKLSEIQSVTLIIETDLLPEFPSDVAKSLGSIKAQGFKSTITQHFCHLCIFLAIFFENQLSFFSFVLVLSPPAIFTSFTY